MAMPNWHIDTRLDSWIEAERDSARRLDLAYHRRCVLELRVADARDAGRDRRVEALTPQLAQARAYEVRARRAVLDAGVAIDNLRVELRSGYRGWEKDQELQRRRGLAA